MQQKHRRSFLFRNVEDQRTKKNEDNLRAPQPNSRNYQFVSPENTVKVGETKRDNEGSAKLLETQHKPVQSSFKGSKQENADDIVRTAIDSQTSKVNVNSKPVKNTIEPPPTFLRPEPPVLYRNVSKDKPINLDFERIHDNRMFRDVHRNRHYSIGKSNPYFSHPFLHSSKIQTVDEEYSEDTETLANIIEDLKTQKWEKNIVTHLDRWVTGKDTALLSLAEDCRNLTLGVMVDYHRTMKLPIEGFYVAVNIFDRVTSKQFNEAIEDFQRVNHRSPDTHFLKSLFIGVEACLSLENLVFLGAASLYTSHKLQKYKLYKISSWAKQFNSENISLLSQALPGFCQLNTVQFEQQTQTRKKFLISKLLGLQAMILITLDFKPWKPHLYDIFLSLCSCIENKHYSEHKQIELQSTERFSARDSVRKATIKNGEYKSGKYITSEDQLYFCLYLLELSGFCNFNRILRKLQLQGKEPMEISLVDISLAVLHLSMHFFRGKGMNKNNLNMNSSSTLHRKDPTARQTIEKLITIIFSGNQQSVPGSHRQFTSGNPQLTSSISTLMSTPNSAIQSRIQMTKMISNHLFRLVSSDKPHYMISIVKKYSKVTNAAVAKFQFIRNREVDLSDSKAFSVTFDDSCKQTPKQEQSRKQAQRTSDSKPRTSIEHKRPPIILSQIDSSQSINSLQRNQSRVLYRNVMKK